VRNLNYTGFSGIGTTIASGFIYGNLTLSATQTIAAATATTTFAATSGTKTITTNGVTIDRPLTFSGIGGAWSLQDELTTAYAKDIIVGAGTFTTNGYAVTCGKFGAGPTSVVGDRTFNFGASSITCLGSTGNSSFQVEPSSFATTVNAGTSTIYLSEAAPSATDQNFNGGGYTYNNVIVTTSVNCSIRSSNTFKTLGSSGSPINMSFEENTTQTVDNFTVSGTAGNLATITSYAPGAKWNIAKRTGGKVLVSYCSITDSAATPAGYWFAPTSQGNVDGGNNTGWNFGSTGQNTGFMMFM